ncbi:MAG: allantoinase AllB [Planctomycetaceae bacterium]
MVHDLLIRGGTVVGPAGPVSADVAVADGRITAVAPEITGRAGEVLDATGCHVLPGVVDPHVHFNDPGRADWEGFATGSTAFAAGGGTLFVDMPLNASPPTLDAASFDAKLAAARGIARTDFALWGGLVPGNVDRLPELAARGVAGFKAFMSGSGIDDFQAADDATLWQGMNVSAELGLPVLVHAENDAITAALAREACAAGRTGIRDYLASRPIVAEVEAIRRAITLAADTGCPLHIVHVSSGEGVAAVVEARARGVDVTCETCPHYLVLTADDVERIGAAAKCAPPLRPAAVQAELWRHVLGGDVAFVASDHSPAPASMKQSTNFFDVWGGIAGVQATLGLMLEDGHGRRGLTLADVVRLTSRGAAERFWLGDRGRIEPGCVADLAIVDLAHAAPLAAADLHDRHRLSPYVGRTLRGRVRRTIVRGRTVWADGRAFGPAIGELVAPVPHPSTRPS